MICIGSFIPFLWGTVLSAHIHPVLSSLAKITPRERVLDWALPRECLDLKFETWKGWYTLWNPLHVFEPVAQNSLGTSAIRTKNITKTTYLDVHIFCPLFFAITCDVTGLYSACVSARFFYTMEGPSAYPLSLNQCALTNGGLQGIPLDVIEPMSSRK